MATKFVKATNNKTGVSLQLHDTDSPVRLFLEIAALNSETGETMKDWTFDLLNFKGERLGKYDWKNAHVSVTLGDLFA